MADRTTLLLGGARSGKSRRALALSEPFPNRVLIATAEAGDDEMALRIARHKNERDQTWAVVEAPYELADAVRGVAIQDAPSVIVVDCLTLWLSNMMLADCDLEAAIADLIEAVDACAVQCILVSNEVGNGIVPDTVLGRDFRDHQGRLNQQMAAAADHVELVVAGLPLVLKSP